jgi:hypothetical protein
MSKLLRAEVELVSVEKLMPKPTAVDHDVKIKVKPLRKCDEAVRITSVPA